VSAGNGTEPHHDEVLRVDDLRVVYDGAQTPAVDGVSFGLRRGELLGLVGESGSGKTTTAMAILGLIKPPGRILSGAVGLDGVDLFALSRSELRRVRWSAISLVPQGAMNALAPMLRVEEQIADAIRAHEHRQPRSALRTRVRDLLVSVGLPEHAGQMFPHELSGGMKQRVCIAMAIALEPKVVVADEPTSALDVVVQRTVAETLAAVQRRLGMATLLIGHDLSLQAQLADRVGVMWQGRLVEIGPVRSIFRAPAHPYTQLLLRSIPSLRSRTWNPPHEVAALRGEAQQHLDARVPLRAVDADHLAAIP
jgi:peptide/nickel transport system ATP-binding protein